MFRPNKSAAKDNRKVEPMATLQIAEGRWLAWKLVNDPGWLANTAFCFSFFVWACLRETCGQVDQVLFMSQRFAGVCFVAGGVLCRQGWQLTPGFYVTGQASHGKPASRDNVKFQMCQKGWYQGRLPTKWISHGLQRQIFLGRHFQLSAMIRLLLYTNSKSKRCQYICVLLFWEALWYIYMKMSVIETLFQDILNILVGIWNINLNFIR